MRVSMLLVPVTMLLMACGAKEEPATDTAAVAAAPAPAMLTEADVAGTWTGEDKDPATGAVVARWTQVCGGGTCKGTVEGQPDTVVSTYRIDADSAFGQTTAYMHPQYKANVVDSWVVRLSSGVANGTQVTKLADKDSVLATSTFTGTKQP
jgi:hypothetical protein